MRMNRGFERDSRKIKGSSLKRPSTYQTNKEVVVITPNEKSKKVSSPKPNNGTKQSCRRRVDGCVVITGDYFKAPGYHQKKGTVYMYPMGTPKGRYIECEMCGTKNSRRRSTCKVCGGCL